MEGDGGGGDFGGFDAGGGFGGGGYAPGEGYKAPKLASELRQLESRIDRLNLACQAMWELLQEQTGIADQVILEKMAEIDLRDGTKDGKMSVMQVSCPQCGKPSNNRRDSCLYCGHELERPHVFE